MLREEVNIEHNGSSRRTARQGGECRTMNLSVSIETAGSATDS
jgi:hypothetical protein